MPDASQPTVGLPEMRLALMSLAGPAQAQRHHVRVGLLQRACSMIETAPQLLQRPEEATLNARQRLAVLRVADALAAGEPGWRERLPDEGADLGFDYLYSASFEDPEWEIVRVTARAAYTELRDRGNPLIG